MASAAQLKAKANFKKAIAYRKKHGCSLKEAFAAIYPKKKAAPKKAAKKKIGKVVKKVSKKAAPKKRAKPVSSHKDTKSHNVNIRVVSGVNSNVLDRIANESFRNLKYLIEELARAKNNFDKAKIMKKNGTIDPFGQRLLLRYPNYIASLKKQITEAKKNIK